MENNNDKVNNIDLTSTSTENQINTIVTETVVNEISLTESVTMEGARIHSTPIQNKQSDSNDIMNMMQSLLAKQSAMLEVNFNAINSRFDMNDTKFNEQNKKLDALNNRLDNSDEKFYEIRGIINKRFDESDEKWDKLIDSTKQMNNGYNTESVVVTENGNHDDGKLSANENINKVSDDSNGEIITNSNGSSSNANQVMNYKVSGGVKISNDESRKLFEVSNRIVISVDELEKEWKESVQVEELQRVNFP